MACTFNVRGKWVGIDQVRKEWEHAKEAIVSDKPVTKPSPGALAKVRVMLQEMGLSDDVALHLPGGIITREHGIKALIKATEGQENAVSIEDIQVALEFIEQKNPKLFSKLINGISQSEIFFDTLRVYKNIYKLPDGRPDIIRIKKEAIAKLLAKKGMNTVEKDETDAMVQTANQWWKDILDYLRGLFNVPSNIKNPLTRSGNVDSVEDVKLNEGVYHNQQVGYQKEIGGRSFISPITGQRVMSKAWATLRKIAKSDAAADKLYEQLFTPEFINWFGNWTKPMKTVYQGYNTDIPDRRYYNYFTTDESEARDYGRNVRAMKVDTTDFLDVKNNPEITRALEKEFKLLTGKTYDLLDRTETGLVTQQEFFNFVEKKGYKGLDYTGYSDSQYLITFGEVSEGNVSQAVDENGEPLVLFNQGSDEYKETGTGDPYYLNIRHRRDGWIENGTYTTSTHSQAKSVYSKRWKTKPNVSPQIADGKFKQAANEELDNYLLKFLEHFHVEAREFEDFKKKFGVDAIGAADLINKILYYSKNRNEDTIPEEAAHFLVMLAGRKHPEIATLINQIHRWSGYREAYNKYYGVYKGHQQHIKVEIVGQMIADALKREWAGRNPDENSLFQRAKGFFTRMIDKINGKWHYEWRKKFTDKKSYLNAREGYYTEAANKFAKQIIAGNFDYLGPKAKGTPLDAEEVLKNSSAHAKNIVKYATEELGARIVGSLAIAAQDEEIFRSSAEPLHDIDFKMDYDPTNKERIDAKMESVGAVPLHIGWQDDNKNAITYSYLVPAPGYKVEVTKRNMTKKNWEKYGKEWIDEINFYENKDGIWTLVYSGPLKKNQKEYAIHPDLLMPVDFFVPKKQKANETNYGVLSSWQDIYIGKLTLSKRGDDERLFMRDKDAADYRALNPKNREVVRTEGLYFQLEDEKKVKEESDESLDKYLLNYLSRYGVKAKEIDDFKKRFNQDGLGVADVINKVIYYTNQKKIDTIPEEAAHMIVMLAGENHPQVQALIANITTWSGWEQVKKDYWEAYKGNINKIKVEAVGHLLRDAIVKQWKGSTPKEQSLFDLIRKFFESFKDYFTAPNILHQSSEALAREVLQGSELHRKQEGEPIDFERALAENPLAQEIFEISTGELNGQFAGKLSGSLAVAAQGEKILRPKDQPIHDLDFYIPYTGNETEAKNDIVEKMKELKAVNIHNGWGNREKGFTTLAYLIPAPGYKVKVIARKDNSFGYAEVIRVTDKHDNEIYKGPIHVNGKNQVDPKILMPVDYFVYDKAESKTYAGKFLSWQDIFLAKKDLGYDEQPAMFSRKKDQLDYVSMEPENTDNIVEEGLYFQLNPQQQTVSAGEQAFDALDEKNCPVINVQDADGDNHYEKKVDPTIENRPKRVTSRADAIYREKYKDKVKTSEQEKDDTESSVFGRAGHADMQEIAERIIDKQTGLPRAIPLPATGQGTFASPAIYQKMEKYVYNLIHSYPTGTRFRFETILYDPGENEAGTSDWIAITPDGVHNQLDWKFIEQKKWRKDFDKTKKRAWEVQLNRYADILKKVYGATIGQNRIMPIEVIYKTTKSGKRYIQDIRLPNTTNKSLKNLPYPVKSEAPPSPRIGTLLGKMNYMLKEMEKELKGKTGPERDVQEEKIATMALAIRKAQVGLDLEHLVDAVELITEEATNFYRANANIWGQSAEGKREKIDFNVEAEKGLTDEQIDKVAWDLKDHLSRMEAFKNIDRDFQLFLEGSEDEDLLAEFSELNSYINGAISDLQDLQKSIQQHSLGPRYGIHKALISEVEVSLGSKLFRGSVDAVTKGTQLFYRIFNTARQRWEVKYDDRKRELKKVFEGVKNWIDTQPDGYQSFIKTMFQETEDGKWVPRIVSIVDKKYYDELSSKTKANERKGKDDKFSDDDLSWVQNNIDLKKYEEEYDKQLKNYTDYFNTIQLRANKAEDAKAKKVAIDKWKKLHDIWESPESAFSPANRILITCPNMDKWTNADYTRIKSIPELLAFHEYMVKSNEESHRIGLTEHRNQFFFPQKRAGLIEMALFQNSGRGTLSALGDNFRATENEFGYINPLTNERENKIFAHYQNSLGTKDANGKTNYEKVSQDIFVVLQEYEWEKSRFEMLTKVEGSLKNVLDVERNKKHLSEKFVQGVREYEEEDGNEVNAKYLQDFMEAMLYRDTFGKEKDSIMELSGLGGTIAKAVNKVTGRTILDEYGNPVNVSVMKSLRSLNAFYNLKTMAFNAAAAISSAVGGHLNVVINAGKHFSKGDYFSAELRVLGKVLTDEEQAKRDTAALAYFMSGNKAMKKHELNKMSFSKAAKILNEDHLRILQSGPEEVISRSITLAFADNTIVEDGKLVNIREYVKDKHRDRWDLPAAERKELRKKMQEEIEELKKRAVSKIIKVENDQVVIPGITQRDDRSVFNVRDKIATTHREATGQMVSDEYAQYQRNVFLKGMVMFKDWIRPLYIKRFGSLEYHTGKQEYEMGRANIFFSTIFTGRRAAANLIGLLAGSSTAEDGIIGLAKDIYKKKQAEYKKRGDTLEMTEEEFIDMYIAAIKNQATELAFALGFLSLLFTLKANAPDDDKDAKTKGLYRWGVRMADKLADELGFFYNPISFKQIATTSLMPSVGLLTDIVKLLGGSFKEMLLMMFGTEEMVEENHVMKYMFNLVPVMKEVHNYLPFVNAELAKDMGMQITGEVTSR